MPQQHSKKIAIVIAPYHKKISALMLRAARDEAQKLHSTISKIVEVPGCYEIPLAVARLMKRRTVDAIVVLGMIEKGHTLHGEVMGHTVAEALLDLELDTNIPIGKGIIGPGATAAQGMARAQQTARGAMRAAHMMLVL